VQILPLGAVQTVVSGKCVFRRYIHSQENIRGQTVVPRRHDLEVHRALEIVLLLEVTIFARLNGVSTRIACFLWFSL
jgi:collagenase-like PrtC family protease